MAPRNIRSGCCCRINIINICIHTLTCCSAYGKRVALLGGWSATCRRCKHSMFFAPYSPSGDIYHRRSLYLRNAANPPGFLGDRRCAAINFVGGGGRRHVFFRERVIYKCCSVFLLGSARRGELGVFCRRLRDRWRSSSRLFPLDSVMKCFL